MKKAFFWVSLLSTLFVTGCGLFGGKGTGHHGELTGVIDRPDWDQYQPMGMVYIPPGSFHMGQNDQDVPYSQISHNRQITISAYFMDETDEADLAALSYASEHNMHIMTARPHNHIGPGQSTKFVVPSFAKQIKSIAADHKDAAITVGNLESERDFTDVRDIVRAYRMIIEQGIAGHAYNIASNHRYKIGDVLNMLFEIADINPDIHVDENLYRPTDYSAILNISRITSETGWKPGIDLQTTLTDIYEDISL